MIFWNEDNFYIADQKKPACESLLDLVWLCLVEVTSEKKFIKKMALFQSLIHKFKTKMLCFHRGYSLKR